MFNLPEAEPLRSSVLVTVFFYISDACECDRRSEMLTTVFDDFPSPLVSDRLLELDDLVLFELLDVPLPRARLMLTLPPADDVFFSVLVTVFPCVSRRTECGDQR